MSLSCVGAELGTVYVKRRCSSEQGGHGALPKADKEMCAALCKKIKGQRLMRFVNKICVVLSLILVVVSLSLWLYMYGPIETERRGGGRGGVCYGKIKETIVRYV